MSLIIFVFIGMAALVFLISALSSLLCFVFRRVRRELVERIITLVITGVFCVSNFDTWVEGGRSFGRGLGTDSWVPVVIIIVIMLLLTFCISLLVVRIGRIYTKKKNSPVQKSILK